MGQKKEEYTQPTAQQEDAQSQGDWDHKGESGTDGTPRILLRKTNFEMNMGKGRTAKVKQQQWKPCR